MMKYHFSENAGKMPAIRIAGILPASLSTKKLFRSFLKLVWAVGAVTSLCLMLAGCSRLPASSPEDLGAFTSYIDGQIPQWLEQHQVPGAAVALVRNGEVAWAKEYGVADQSGNIPVTANTVFQVASISKAVTSWGVMRLVQEGRLDLDAPVEQYLTRWHLPPSSYDADGVTIRRLLSHSAGLSLHGYPGLAPDQPLPSLEESLSGNNGGAGDVRITMEPGAQHSYSGGGYTLLQLVVEEVTGESFSAYMQHAVLHPLGMSQSSFEWRTDLQPATAVGYDHFGQPYPNYLFTEKAAAGLYTTASDLARFVAAEMSGPHGEPAGRGVLAPETLNLMFTPYIQLPGIEGKLFGTSMGLGHFIETLPDGSKAISHSGSNMGWQLTFMALPERGEGIVILTNSDRGTNLYVDVLRLWGRWLHSGVPGIVTFYQVMGSVVLGLAALLGVGLVFRVWWLVRKMRQGKRQWIWQVSARPSRWGYLGSALSTLLCAMIAIGWWVVVQPILSAFASGQAIGLTCIVWGWCLSGAVAALLRPVKA